MEETLAALGPELVEATATREALEKEQSQKAEGETPVIQDLNADAMDYDDAEEEQNFQDLIANQDKLGSALEAMVAADAPLTMEQAQETQKRARELLTDMKARTADITTLRKVRRTVGKTKGAQKLAGGGVVGVATPPGGEA